MPLLIQLMPTRRLLLNQGGMIGGRIGQSAPRIMSGCTIPENLFIRESVSPVAVGFSPSMRFRLEFAALLALWLLGLASALYALFS